MMINSNDEPTLIKSLGFGFNLIKRHGDEPSFEVWQGTGSIRDLLYKFDSNSQVQKFLVEKGYCADYREAIKLINKGGYDA